MTKLLTAALGVALALIGFLGSRAVEDNTRALQELRDEIAEFRKMVGEDRERIAGLEALHGTGKRWPHVRADSLIAPPD